MAKPEQIKDIAKRVAALEAGGYRVVVVVSAMGKTTDQLVDLAYQVSASPNRRELDMLLTTGERVSMALLSMALNELGCQAISFTGSQAGVFTDELHSNARIMDVRPSRLESELTRGHVVVLAGFQGVSPRTKEVTTLGRGGSDTTAVAMAAYFRAERCEILKDVDGVHSSDPNAVQGTVHLPEMHYLELLEMTFWGAKVLHYRSAELAHLLAIPLLITLAHQGPNGPGTKQTVISGEPKMYEQARILSVNAHKDVRWLSVTKSDPAAALETLATTLSIASLPLPQLLDSENRGTNWAFLVTAPSETLNAIQKICQDENPLSLGEATLASVTATCQGSFASQLPQEIAGALQARSVVVHKMIFSALSITVIIDSKERERAMQLIHDLRIPGSPLDVNGARSPT